MIDTQRFILYTALFVIGLLLWQEWQKDMAKLASKEPDRAPSNLLDTPSFAGTENGEEQMIPDTVPTIGRKREPTTVTSKDVIKVNTDTLSLSIDLNNGQIVSAKLKKYSEKLGNPKPIELLKSGDDVYHAQFGIAGIPGVKGPIHFKSEQAYYDLQDKDELMVNLIWQQDNFHIKRTYHFRKGSYLIDIDTKVENKSSKAWKGHLYHQLLRKKPSKDEGFWGISPYVGASMSDPANKLYKKISFTDIEKNPFRQTVKSGWVAMQQKYFLLALIPQEGSSNEFFTEQYQDEKFAVGVITPIIALPNDSTVKNMRLFIGPEDSDMLSAIAKGLELTIDYGWLWFISSILFTLMKYIYNLVGNWGWSIVLVTLLIKIAFYKLSAASYRSMANLRKFQPRIEQLKQRYGDDKQKFSQAMLELYRKEKINPLGGCLPIVIQIPVFIALYWVLLESVELRHAPFILWINDLSESDPYYVLPLIMGLSMFLQQKLTPAPPDPTQAKVMMAMPVVFTLLFLNFASGLVLYWVVNNVLSIAQQWYITQKYSEPKKS